jgi:hypothetical protein
MASSLKDDELVGVLQRYLTILQGHPSAERMMEQTLTDDFETGFIGGQVWRGIDGCAISSPSATASSTRSTRSRSCWNEVRRTAMSRPRPG